MIKRDEHFIAFRNKLINSIIQEYESLILFIIWHKDYFEISFLPLNVIILSLCMQRRYGHHNVSLKSVNHWWFIEFIAWRYFTHVEEPPEHK